jgi:hypothetical protein
MSQKLSWDEITALHHDEWVELVDYEWDETEPDPKSGVVRVHSKDPKEFERLIKNNPPQDSALLFVGKINLPEGITLNSNQNQFTK